VPGERHHAQLTGARRSPIERLRRALGPYVLIAPAAGFIGLIFLYATLERRDYVMVTALAMMFAIMTSYTRARAESLIKKCKVGFMERPERIVLFMVGAFTNRMAAVLWVILILSIFTVADRIILTYRELRDTGEAIA